jgi:hypothetical protein
MINEICKTLLLANKASAGKNGEKGKIEEDSEFPVLSRICV